MRIPRIYVSADLQTGATLGLEPEAARHVTRVLRLKPPAQLVLFNGRGGEYTARIANVRRDGVDVVIESFSERSVESPLHITLAQGISRGERMEYTIQKSVELGVAEIVPLFTERCMVTLKGERLYKRVHHWQGIVNSACEQCGRNTVPVVRTPHTLIDWLDSDTRDVKLILDPHAESAPGALQMPHQPVMLLIGPEGGLSPAERSACLQAGYRGVRLGPRILRTETAAVAALSAIQLLWGDLG
jgi:16S rRNA (uracil1498-N3)-methyltransferase